MRSNPPPKGVKKGKGAVTTDPKSVSAVDRVKSYPDEKLTVCRSKLFCTACREELALKKSVLESHISSQKQATEGTAIEIRKAGERHSQALMEYDDKIHPVGEGLPNSTRVHRVKVVVALSKAGVPISNGDCFRDLLEENATSLTSSTNLRQLLPFVLHQEMSRLKQEISGRHVSIV